MTGYRTYIAATLVAIFGALASTDWIAFLNDPKAGAVALASAVLMAVMRAFYDNAGGEPFLAAPVGALNLRKPPNAAIMAAARGGGRRRSVAVQEKKQTL